MPVRKLYQAGCINTDNVQQVGERAVAQGADD
jgi:hypothetical protein